MRARTFVPLVLVAGALGCASQPSRPMAMDLEIAVDSARVVEDLRFLSDRSLGGRATGSAGNRTAREYIVAELEEAGVRPLGGEALTRTFALQAVPGAAGRGVNVIGVVRGRERPERYIVVSAHYDHLGTRDGVVFPGADDNASGTAALLEIARQLAADPPRSSVIFAALDAEEIGLQGARALVADPPVPLDAISLNLNMDMVGRNEAGELFVAGLHHYPFLEPVVDEVAAGSPLELRRGHDRPDGSAGDDWTTQSDHGAFHEAGIPFLYFGVEDHADYHRPTDTFEGIEPAFFVDAVGTVLRAVRVADARLAQIEAASRD